ncbi:hypothetical protein [Propionivibrio sp.]|uniref:hypothetical protein n=1 Tax=Propionivibrio sp. TaxID=2212460 RepID=UPI003BF3CD89
MVEDPLTMVERLKSPSFLLQVAMDVNDPEWTDAINAGGGTTILTALVPKTNPGLVELKVKARSQDEAKKIALTATNFLTKRQEEQASQILKKINYDLLSVKEKLKKAEADLVLLSKTIDSKGMKDEIFSQLSLLTSIKLQMDSDVFSLRQSIFAMEISLLPPATRPAQVLEDIFVSSKPVSPKKRLLLALGLVGGLSAGVLAVFVSGAWRKAREHR